MSSTRVVIVDDHPTFRRGLRTLLERLEDVAVVGEAGSGEEALELVASTGADLVVMDVLMPGIGGIEATRRLRAAHPGIGVLVMTMNDTDDSVFMALRAGARGYVLKDAEPETLEGAVRAVAAGRVLLDARAGDRMTAYFRGDTAAVHPFPELTNRERDVLALLAEGLSNAAIGKRLCLAPKTIRNHLTAIFAKLGVADRGQAIVRAREAGLGS